MSDQPFDYYADRIRKGEAAHTHDHGDHDHDDHAPVNEHDNGPPGEFEIMSRAMQELLEEKGVVTAEQVRARMELFEQDFPFRGPRVVARAWADPEFKKRLLEDGRAACLEMGVELETERLIAVENTPEVHNMIVCTLCSCYPRALLGMPPTWYKSRNYRSRVVFEPRAVLKEFGTELPDNVTVRVHDSNADMRYVVIPIRPQGTEGWSEDKLATILTRDTLVGVTVPRVSS
ncbi:MAG TPA: nitrile hydratase subunit alpha [Burkholderiales bacterium]|nr:nitrile hydratase subunit alpha [Burkholderiales bacterium]